MLLALNRLWTLGLPRSELAAIGATLGADVPFFIGGESALARGIGELLTPVSLPTLWIALVVPPVEVATKAIFKALQLTRFAASAKIDVFSEGYGRNDLEPGVAARFPAVAGAITGWSPSLPLRDGLAVTAEWYRENLARYAVDSLQSAADLGRR